MSLASRGLNRENVLIRDTSGMRARLLALCGVLSPAAAFTAIGVSVALSPWFSWQRNALSDLGSLSSLTWPIFNTGLVLAGLLGSVFTFYLLKLLRGKIRQFGCLLLLLASLSLALIGVFPEETGRLHGAVALAFFILIPCALMVIGISALLWPNGFLTRPLGLLKLACGLTSLLTWILWALLGAPMGLAVPELLAAFASSAGLVALSLRAISVEAKQAG